MLRRCLRLPILADIEFIEENDAAQGGASR